MYFDWNTAPECPVGLGIIEPCGFLYTPPILLLAWFETARGLNEAAPCPYAAYSISISVDCPGRDPLLRYAYADCVYLFGL